MATEVSWNPVKETAWPIQSRRNGGSRSGRVSMAALRASRPARADHEARVSSEDASVAGREGDDGESGLTGSVSPPPICPVRSRTDDGIAGGRASGWAALA